jgi:hypothetical protein
LTATMSSVFPVITPLTIPLHPPPPGVTGRAKTRQNSGCGPPKTTPFPLRALGSSEVLGGRSPGGPCRSHVPSLLSPSLAFAFRKTHPLHLLRPPLPCDHLITWIRAKLALAVAPGCTLLGTSA